MERLLRHLLPPSALPSDVEPWRRWWAFTATYRRGSAMVMVAAGSGRSVVVDALFVTAPRD
jgi:hypothetical protein